MDQSSEWTNFEEELRKMSDKHLADLKTSYAKNKTKVEGSLISCNMRVVNYMPETLKDSLKSWSYHKQELSAFRSENAIDLLILGTEKSGKSSLIKALSGDDKMFTAASSKVNDIIKIDLDGAEIVCREMSHSFLKTWDTFRDDAKIMVVVGCYE